MWRNEMPQTALSGREGRMTHSGWVPWQGWPLLTLCRGSRALVGWWKKLAPPLGREAALGQEHHSGSERCGASLAAPLWPSTPTTTFSISSIHSHLTLFTVTIVLHTRLCQFVKWDNKLVFLDAVAVLHPASNMTDTEVNPMLKIWNGNNEPEAYFYDICMFVM